MFSSLKKHMNAQFPLHKLDEKPNRLLNALNNGIRAGYIELVSVAYGLAILCSVIHPSSSCCCCTPVKMLSINRIYNLHLCTCSCAVLGSLVDIAGTTQRRMRKRRRNTRRRCRREKRKPRPPRYGQRPIEPPILTQTDGCDICNVV